MPAAIPPQSRSQLTVDVRADALVRLPLAMREHLYQIARESVTNALRHGHARQVAVRMDVTDAYVQLRVEDDGVGFDPRSARAAGLGLRSMALRSAAVHGTLSLQRRRDGGMAVVCRAPQAP
jgi:signal transduction histidine kinase